MLLLLDFKKIMSIIQWVKTQSKFFVITQTMCLCLRLYSHGRYCLNNVSYMGIQTYYHPLVLVLLFSALLP